MIAKGSLVMKPAATLLITVLLAGPAWACAGCRLPGQESETATILAGAAFSWGVLLMLAFVFSLFGGLGAYMLKTVREADASHRAS
jgi:hypothetical protein